jgi:membrane-bound lytic murein transglycosylase
VSPTKEQLIAAGLWENHRKSEERRQQISRDPERSDRMKQRLDAVLALLNEGGEMDRLTRACFEPGPEGDEAFEGSGRIVFSAHFDDVYYAVEQVAAANGLTYTETLALFIFHVGDWQNVLPI